MIDGAALWKCLTIWGVIIGSGFGLPIPEEIPVVTGGVLVGKSDTDVAEALEKGEPPPSHIPWWLMLPGTIIAVVIGDSVLYFGGRWFGPRLLRSTWFQRKIMPPDALAKIADQFHKRGVMILLAARLTPGVRMPVFLSAGMLRMPVSRFLLADGLYAIPGVSLLFWLGYLFTDKFLAALKAAEEYRPWVIVGVLTVVALVVVYKLFWKRKLSTGDMADVPGIMKPVGAVTHAIEQGIERTMETGYAAAAKVVDVVTHPLGREKEKLQGHAETPKLGEETPIPPIK
jgi:membrane protein DedA with SNARE-associated domain